jgi:hypothetical protein
VGIPKVTETVEERRERLEEELAAAEARLAGAVQTGERERLEAVVQDLQRKLERLLLAIEIERQSDA